MCFRGNCLNLIHIPYNPHNELKYIVQMSQKTAIQICFTTDTVLCGGVSYLPRLT